jgi:hypothetical protein
MRQAWDGKWDCSATERLYGTRHHPGCGLNYGR